MDPGALVVGLLEDRDQVGHRAADAGQVAAAVGGVAGVLDHQLGRRAPCRRTGSCTIGLARSSPDEDAGHVGAVPLGVPVGRVRRVLGGIEEVDRDHLALVGVDRGAAAGVGRRQTERVVAEVAHVGVEAGVEHCRRSGPCRRCRGRRPASSRRRRGRTGRPRSRCRWSACAGGAGRSRRRRCARTARPRGSRPPPASSAARRGRSGMPPWRPRRAVPASVSSAATAAGVGVGEEVQQDDDVAPRPLSSTSAGRDLRSDLVLRQVGRGPVHAGNPDSCRAARPER